MRGSRSTARHTPGCNLDGDEHRPVVRSSIDRSNKSLRRPLSARFAFTLVPENRPIAGFDLRTVHTCPRILISVYDCVRAASVIAARGGLCHRTGFLRRSTDRPDRPTDRPIDWERKPHLVNRAPCNPLIARIASVSSQPIARGCPPRNLSPSISSVLISPVSPNGDNSHRRKLFRSGFRLGH